MLILLGFIIALAALVLWLEWENMRVHRLLHEVDGQILASLGEIITYLKRR